MTKDAEQSQRECRCDVGVLGGHHDVKRVRSGIVGAGHRMYFRTIFGMPPSRQGAGLSSFASETWIAAFIRFPGGGCFPELDLDLARQIPGSLRW